MALTELGDRLGPFAGDLEQRAVAAQYPQGDPLRGGPRAAAMRRAAAGRLLGACAQPRDEELSLDGARRRIDEQLSLGRDHVVAAGDVDDTEDAARFGIVHGHGRARPRLHQAVEVLRPADLHRSVQRERGARSGGADGALGPVRPRDETHVAGQGADVVVALDPEQPARRVSHGDDDTGLGCLAGQQQRPDHVHHARERMGTAVLIEFGAHEVERRQPFRSHQVGQRAAPRFLHERADIAHAAVDVVACDQLFVRALDQQAGGLRRDLAPRRPRR